MRKSDIDYIDTVIEFMKEMTSGRPVIFFDLETTGLNTSLDRILSCSAIKVEYNGGRFDVTDKMDFFMNPGFHIPEVVTQVNGITDDMVKDAPNEDDGYDTIAPFFGDAPVVAGYNSVNFDQHFMENMYMRAAGEKFTPKIHLDVMKMAKEKLDMTSYKLSEVTDNLGCGIGLTFHQSIDDVYATYRIFKLLLGQYLKEEKAERTVRVTGAKYWAPSHTLARVYFYTKPETKTYYDIYKKAWCSDMEGLNLEDVKMQALRCVGANNEKELVSLVKAESRT